MSAMVPQWDLLALIADAAGAEPNFTLRMRPRSPGCCATGAASPGFATRARTARGASRRPRRGLRRPQVAVRRDAGLPIREYPVPFDVWWFRLPREQGGQYSLIPRTKPGRALIMIPREGYFQIAYLIPKGS